MLLQCCLGVLKTGQGREISDLTSTKAFQMDKANELSGLAFIFPELSGDIYSVDNPSPLKTLPQLLFTIFSWHTVWFSVVSSQLSFWASLPSHYFRGRCLWLLFYTLYNLPTHWFPIQTSDHCHLPLGISKGISLKSNFTRVFSYNKIHSF